jgi:hypothetical protein
VTLGGHVEQCDDCGMVRIAYNSCRDRHCPKCQGLARAQWLADRQADLLPVPTPCSEARWRRPRNRRTQPPRRGCRPASPAAG